MYCIEKDRHVLSKQLVQVLAYPELRCSVLWKDLKQTGGFQDCPSCGRPKKMSQRNVRTLRRLSEDAENRSSAHEITIKLNESLKKPVCRRTVINYLQKCDLQCKVKIQKPFLNRRASTSSPSVVFRTLAGLLMIGIESYSAMNQQSTLSDVKMKQKKNGVQNHDKWREDCMAVADTGGGYRVGFWSVITCGRNGLFSDRIYNKNTGSDVYCDILDSCLVPAVQRYDLEDNYFFQYDNGRYHTSKQTQAKSRAISAKMLKWPAKKRRHGIQLSVYGQ